MPDIDVTTLVYFFIGLLLLPVGGTFVVRGSVSAAGRLGVSPMLIGITLVGFGTSLPELLTSVQAMLHDAPGIAVGNVIGSNIANVLLILGIAALLCPIESDRKAFFRDGPVLAVSTLVVTFLILMHWLTLWTGIILITSLVIYVGYSFLAEQNKPSEWKELQEKEAQLAELEGYVDRPVSFSLLEAFGGIVATLVGARLLVVSAVSIAESAGIPQSVIGLTAIALGTSLPELATAVAAAAKNEPSVALGNIVGSNIFNLLGILGAAAVTSPVIVPASEIGWDILMMIVTTAVCCLVIITDWKVTRREGILLLAGYFVYLGIQATKL